MLYNYEGVHENSLDVEPYESLTRNFLELRSLISINKCNAPLLLVY
jgi:hypothetical protein